MSPRRTFEPVREVPSFLVVKARGTHVFVSRENVIIGAARSLEFKALSYSSTSGGYSSRVNDALSLISEEIRSSLTSGHQMHEDEDAQEIVDVMKGLCRM